MSWIEVPSVSTYEHFNISELEIDQAWVNISSLASVPLWLYELSTDCLKCPYQRIGRVDSLNKFVIDTMYPLKYRFRLEGSQIIAPEEHDRFPSDSSESHYFSNLYLLSLIALIFFFCFANSKFCDLEHSFGEFGVYDIWTIGDSAQNADCGVNTLLEPVNIYLPILIVVLFYIFLGLVVLLTRKYIFSSKTPKNVTDKAESNPTKTNEVVQPSSIIFNGEENSDSRASIRRTSNIPANANESDSNPNVNQNQRLQDHQPSASDQSKPTAPKQRLRSLDTLRGLCIVIMMFVHDGGAHYYFMDHATWDGLRVADLVFPWFLWCMGISTSISISSQVKRTPKLTIFKRIFIRSLKLIGVGLMLSTVSGSADIETMRFPGVLQRFGICYFVTSTLLLLCLTTNLKHPEGSKFKAVFQDIKVIWISWIAVLLLVLLHCLLTFYLNVPGCGKGYLGPGGLHENGAHMSDVCVGGAAGYIDRKILTVSHIYQWPTAKYTYNSEEYDPEGILGVLTTILQVWLGVQTGITMLVFPRPSSRLIRWGAWALVTGALGTLLCGGTQTGGWIPINKNLWSLSFVLVTNCFALILLSVLYVIIDIKKYWSGTPFFEPGMNSILLYVSHLTAHSMLPWHYRYGIMRTHFSRLVESLWGISLWIMIAIYLYQKKTFWIL